MTFDSSAPRIAAAYGATPSARPRAPTSRASSRPVSPRSLLIPTSLPELPMHNHQSNTHPRGGASGSGSLPAAMPACSDTGSAHAASLEGSKETPSPTPATTVHASCSEVKLLREQLTNAMAEKRAMRAQLAHANHELVSLQKTLKNTQHLMYSSTRCPSSTEAPLSTTSDSSTTAERQRKQPQRRGSVGRSPTEVAVAAPAAETGIGASASVVGSVDDVLQQVAGASDRLTFGRVLPIHDIHYYVLSKENALCA